MAIRSAAKAIVLQDGKVLLNKYVGNLGEVYYDLPGGGQHQFETMEDAVVRECLEETGFTVRVVRFAALVEEIYDDEELRKQYYDYTHRIHHIFLAEIAGQSQNGVTEMDIHQVACEWITIENVSDIDIRPALLRGNIERILSSDCPVYLGSFHVK